MGKPEADKSNELPLALVMELYESYNELAGACLALQEVLHSEGNDYPVYIPTFGQSDQDHESIAARDAAIKAITQLYVLRKDEVLPEAGIVCASPNAVGKVIGLNNAKSAFKDAVMSIRNFQKDTESAGSKITKLIRDEVTEKGFRTEALRKAMGTVGIASLDLKRCYAQIRIMPEHLTAFSWTWATTHSRIKKVTLDEAIEMAKSIPDEEKSKIALDILGRCNSEDMFAIKTLLPNQLRANYAYLVDGKVERKSCPISGVVIAQQSVMPRKFWRNNPGKQENNRLERESVIESDVLIKSLGLHRYV